MNKKMAMEIILNCSKMYHENLENRDFKIIFKDKSKKFNSIDINFKRRNFLHLTGINILSDKIKTSTDFYNTCLNQQLRTIDFEFKSKLTTPLKLKILPSAMQIYKNAKMIGIYNQTKKELKTEKLIGGINFCLGCIRNKNGYYVPNNKLYEDIRDITYEQNRIALILRENIEDKQYKEITYINKKLLENYKDKLIKYCKKEKISIKF